MRWSHHFLFLGIELLLTGLGNYWSGYHFIFWLIRSDSMRSDVISAKVRMLLP